MLVFSWAATGGRAQQALEQLPTKDETEALSRPKPGERPAASDRAGKELGDARAKLDHASFLVLGSTRPIDAEFEGAEDNFQLGVKAQDPEMTSGLAVAITADGYLLTAGHVVQPYLCVVGRSGGKQCLAAARVVHAENGLHAGAEFALLKVDLDQLEPVEWSEAVATGALYACCREDDPQFRRIVLAGQARDDLRGGAKAKHGRVIATDIPFFHGDSGGGVYDRAGRLVGVVIGTDLPYGSTQVSHLVFAPKPTFVDDLIAKDRAKPAGK